MTGGSWFDTIAFAVVGVVCLGLIARRVIGAFSESAGAGCSHCSKGCHGGSGEAAPNAPPPKG